MFASPDFASSSGKPAFCSALILSIDSVPILIDLLIALKNGKYKINRKVINIENKSSIFKKLCFCF